MMRFLRFWRLFKIQMVLMRHTFNRTVLGSQSRLIWLMSFLNPLSFTQQGKNRGESIRLALEHLGPIFVKFGQLLSTRRDLLPDDIADELAKLQDQVPPFEGEKARVIIEKAFNKSVQTLFAQFDETALASASIAQVHAATLHTGEDVVVKVLRPKVLKVIRHDIAILYAVAKLMERFWSHGKRIHPVALVAEFEQTIIDELDLMREAANASQLRRNFIDSPIMYVPKIYWDLTRKNVMVMERIYGTRISDIADLKMKHVNMKRLAENGVQIFFTQVFRDNFFHADMHPGNLFVDTSDPEHPKYLGVDFGIMGTLSPEDQHYLAENLLAFFNQDYRRVAVLHIQSGWVPPNTRVDQFESAIRTVSEPIFEKPLAEISFGHLLLRLFQTAERFQMEVQPQLMLLQKTLLAIEGLGRDLYPELDLWETAQPFMENRVKERKGLKKLSKEFVRNIDTHLEHLAQTPSVLHSVLTELSNQQLRTKYRHKYHDQPTNNRRGFAYGITIAFVAVTAAGLLTKTLNPAWLWASSGIALVAFLFGWCARQESNL